MIETQVVFLQALSLGRPRREQELELTRARSHAAKAGLQRAKKARRDSQSAVVSVPERRLLCTQRHSLQQAGGQVNRNSHRNQCVSSMCPQQHISTDEQEVQTDAITLPFDAKESLPQSGPRNRAWGIIPSYLSLGQGNSDPFSAFAIPINARVNDLMAFVRESYCPESITKSKDWERCVSLLQDESTAYAHLARVAAAMVPAGSDTRDHQLKNEALILKSKGSQLLRERIRRGVVDYKTAYIMSCFLCAELHSQEFAVARLHADMLARLFQGHNSPVDCDLLQGALYHDTQRATATLTRPSFDVEKWVPEQLAKHFAPLLEALPDSMSLEAMESDLDESIDDGKLKDIIVKLRQGLVLFLSTASAPGHFPFDLKFYMRNLVTISICRLVNHYLDAERTWRSYKGSVAWESTLIGHAHVQAFASLAIILWLRSIARVNNIKVTGSSVPLDANEVLMTRLRESLIASQWMTLDHTQQTKYGSIRLWAFYVGAYIEQLRAEASGTIDLEDVSNKWFNRKLVLQASAMGLVSWDEVRQRLAKILYTDVLTPHGSRWFAKTRSEGVSMTTYNRLGLLLRWGCSQHSTLECSLRLCTHSYVGDFGLRTHLP